MGEQVLQEEQTTYQKPDWLERLEQESWQAELIISGLALYGLFMVPPYINSIGDYLIKNLSPDEYFLGNMLMVMAFLGISILCGFFLIHFVLRSFWIGLIGLNSIHPHGYGNESGFYSTYFIKKFAKELPPVLETIKKLDQICSPMFASAFMVSMIYASFFLVFSIAMLISRFLVEFGLSWLSMLPFFILGAYFVIMVIIMTIAGNKRFHENERIQDIYVKASKYGGYLMGTVFYVPINQISLTFFSNQKTKTEGLGVTMIFMFVCFVLYVNFIDASNIEALVIGEISQDEEVQSMRMENSYYENTLNTDLEILNPVLPSDQIKGAFLKIFIPVFDHEEQYRDNFCDDYLDNEDIHFRKNRSLKRNHNIGCMKKYHQIFVNDSLYQEDFIRFRHPNNQEYGIVTYLPTKAFKYGRNDLRIMKLKEPGGEAFRKDFIPFWFARE